MEMAMLLQEMAASLLRRPSLEGFVIWTGMVGVAIWLPSLVPSAIQGIVRHFCQASLVGFLLAALFPLEHSVAGTGSSLSLLEVTALGLAATWAWLERMRGRGASLKMGFKAEPTLREASAEAFSAVPQTSHPQDLLNAVRLALWLTLSLMPVVRWF